MGQSILSLLLKQCYLGVNFRSNMTQHTHTRARPVGSLSVGGGGGSARL